MHHRVREVEDKRLLGIALVLKEVNRLIGIEADKTAHILGGTSGLIIFMELDRTIVIGTQRTEVIIKALRIGHTRDDGTPIGYIPFTDAGCLITNLANELSPSDLISRHPPTTTTNWLTTCKQCRARWSTNGLGIERGKTRTFLGQPIEPRRLVLFVPVTCQIDIALIIGEDNHNIGFYRLISCLGNCSDKRK